MSEKIIQIEWSLRKVKTLPSAFIRVATLLPKKNPDITYLPEQAARFSRKKYAEDYARKLYAATGIAWEPIAFTREENDNAEKTF